MALDREVIHPPGIRVREVDGKRAYAPAVAVGRNPRHIFVAGQVSRDGEGRTVGVGDMRAQVEKVCENVKLCLEAAGASLADIVKLNMYVTDIDAFQQHTDLRMRYFSATLSASTLVEVTRLAHPDFLVEIEAVAVIEG